MKLKLALWVGLAMRALSSHAVELSYDGFDYPGGASLHGQNGGTGFTGAWVEGGASGDYDKVQTGSLTFGSLATSGASVSSAAPVALTTDLSRPMTTIPGAPGNTLWISYLTRKDSPGGLSPEDYCGLVLYPSVGDGLFVGDPFENDLYSLGVVGTGIGLVASNVPVTPSADATFLAVKIEFALGNDTISLFINPTPGGPVPTSANAVKSDFDLLDISALGFLAGSSTVNPLRSFDEIRFGTSFADIAPIPEPSVSALIGLGLLALRRGRRQRRRAELLVNSFAVERIR